jgi:hypothetical protein
LRDSLENVVGVLSGEAEPASSSTSREAGESRSSTCASSSFQSLLSELVVHLSLVLGTSVWDWRCRTKKVTYRVREDFIGFTELLELLLGRGSLVPWVLV